MQKSEIITKNRRRSSKIWTNRKKNSENDKQY